MPHAWLLDNYRVRRWYYRDAPNIGDKVRYIRDGWITHVTAVTPFTIHLADGTGMRRPYPCTRLAAWLMQRLTATTQLPQKPTNLQYMIQYRVPA